MPAFDFNDTNTPLGDQPEPLQEDKRDTWLWFAAAPLKACLLPRDAAMGLHSVSGNPLSLLRPLC